jgi:hypothetical protein
MTHISLHLQLTLWCIVLEKQIICAAIQQILTLYGTHRFITMLMNPPAVPIPRPCSKFCNMMVFMVRRCQL